jgi:hypothetical protein
MNLDVSDISAVDLSDVGMLASRQPWEIEFLVILMGQDLRAEAGFVVDLNTQ